MLVSARLITLVEMQYVPAWIVIVIISREFAVTGLRLVLAGTGEVVAANQLGKLRHGHKLLRLQHIYYTMYL